MSEIKDYAIKCFQDEAQAILDLIPLLTDDFDKTIDLIYHSRGKLVVTGVGKSGHCGAKIAATLASTGTPSFFINPLDAFHGDLGMISSNDIVLAISNSGQTDELLRFIPFLKERNIPLIGMSGNPLSLLGQYADYHLNIAIKHEACPLNLAPTSSTTATLAMGDAIACALMNVRNFQEKDFARFHPGGSLGKRLLTKVRDVMRVEGLPIVASEMYIPDVLLEISEHKLCIALVFDNDNFYGIVSDGDIRRAIQKYHKDIFHIPVIDIVNRTPIIIDENRQLIEAEALFKQYNIHVLVVMDKYKKVVGVLELNSCIF